ncbi:copper-exporting ATPase [Firmicutes bacterium CAG:822]|nr:copper-exporting ATPase [Firmicutes bacterium CAG:822]
MQRIILSIDGMTCSACSNGLEKYLNKQNGIYNASVNLVMANATIDYDEKILDIPKLETFVKKAGFKSLGEFKEIKFEAKSKNEKTKLIIFTILAIILMYISMGHMLNLPALPYLDPHKHVYPYMITLLLLTISFLIYGFDIIKNGYKNLIHNTPNMDTLVAIGVLTSFLYSLYNMYLVFKGNQNAIMNLYFESSAIVIYFIKLGRFIDGASKDKTKEAISKLVTITPTKATIKKEDTYKEVTLDEIKKGDIVICKAGEKITVDGEIIYGKAHFDDSFITGESKPINKTIGAKVLAGSLNYDGYIEYKAEKIGKDSTISEIVRLVIEASNTKSPISKVADKVSGIFVPIVILIAIITLILYLLITKDLSESLITFVTILVIACPCSLGLATPLAIVVSEGKCASEGILIKKSEILENVQKVDTIIFDKTGTLTYGKLKISKVINYSNLEDQKLLQLAASLEAKSSHPISKAFEGYMSENNVTQLEVSDFENIPGFGIKGKVENEEIMLGNSKLLDKYNIENNHAGDENVLSSNGNSIIYVIKNNEIIALIGACDIIRENVKNVIKELQEQDITTVILTGDNERAASKIAKELGITIVYSNVVPTEKAEVIKRLKEENKYIMMCGDGINDSPALSLSDIGVSIHGATDIAMDSSDVILTQNNLNSILKLINISKKTFKIIKQNLFWAFFYNLIMIPIAIGILKPIGITITPMIASLAMVFSSITVILNTLRLKKLK